MQGLATEKPWDSVERSNSVVLGFLPSTRDVGTHLPAIAGLSLPAHWALSFLRARFASYMHEFLLESVSQAVVKGHPCSLEGTQGSLGGRSARSPLFPFSPKQLHLYLAYVLRCPAERKFWY